MTDLIIIRHGPTAWNAEGRIQGSVDEPLSDAGRKRVAGWRVPDDLRDRRWYASPKRRAWETARLLGLDPIPEPRLVEMSWGDWEGRLIRELLDSGAMPDRHDRLGLDFRPPGGESPREMQDRLRSWLADIAGSGQAAVGAVAHSGLIRSLYALATHWNMEGVPADSLQDACAHRFRLSSDGMPSVVRLNIPLESDSASR